MSPYFVLLIAIIPAVALMIFIYLQDNHEKEPIGLLLGIFGLGILSAIPAVILEKIAEIINDLIFGGMLMLRLAITAFFGVAVIEEGVKFIAAYLPTWRNRHFNYKFDGIVYCIAGSMGFAAIENVLYLVQQYYLDNTQIISMGVQRGLLAIPAHGMCAIFMGYYYGNAKYAKSYGDRAGCRGYMIRGYLIACSLHAFYDFCLFTENPVLYFLFLVYVVVADVLTIIRIIKAKKENQKMYEAPQYRNYWADNLSNPYQEYGGYQAPTYGDYNYQTPAHGGPYANPNNSLPQPQPQVIVPASFRNQMIYCPVCGQTNNFNAFYCTSCGGSLHGNRA